MAHSVATDTPNLLTPQPGTQPGWPHVSALRPARPAGADDKSFLLDERDKLTEYNDE